MNLANIGRPYRDKLFWALQAGGWGAYSLERAVSPGNFFPHGFSHLAILIVLTSLLHPVYYRLSIRRPRLWVLAGVATAASVTGAIVMPVLDYLLPFLPPGPSPYRSIAGAARSSVLHVFARDGLVAFLLWSAAYFAIRQWDLARRDREQALQAQMSARDAELKMLHAELNPHFLFNALNSIQALVREDPERAERTLAQFSGFLVYSLREAGTERVSLRDEMRAVEAYLAIQKTRFEDALDVSIEYSEEAGSVVVPPLLIYPLVENAVKHGMQGGVLPVRVRVTAACRSHVLSIQVANTGQWRTPTAEGRVGAGLGLGLSNVRARLAQIYPARHRLDVSSRDGWVRVTAEIDHP